MVKKSFPDILMKKIKDFNNKCEKFGVPIHSIRKLENYVEKFEGKIFLIGGNVRDLILEQNTDSNPDLVVNLKFNVLLDCLKKSKLKFSNIGADYGSVVVYYENCKFDITSMRTDIETDGRWAKINFTNDLEIDSKRRDFTFNSIYCNTDGNLTDPNEGIKDLINRKVRFIGKISDRINEDHLRILRFFRFSLQISHFFEDKILHVCNDNLNKLSKLSYERRVQELKKIILNEKIKEKKNLSDLEKLLESSLESKLNFKNFINLCYLESDINDKSFERRIKFLVRSQKSIPSFLSKNADNKFKKRLNTKILIENYSDTKLNHILYNYEKVYVIDKLIFDFLDKLISSDIFEYYYKKVINFQKMILPINGNDLLKIGFIAGRHLGKTMKNLENWWINNNFEPNKNDCIEFVRKFLP